MHVATDRHRLTPVGRRTGRRAPRRPGAPSGVVAVALLGAAAGAGWWAWAPGGLLPPAPDATEVVVAQDGTLTLLGLACGVLVGAVALRRPTARPGRTVALAVAASLAAGVVAWQTGVRLDALSAATAPAADPSGGSVEAVLGARLALHSLSVLLVWPLGTAVLLFAATVVSALREPRAHAGPGALAAPSEPGRAEPGRAEPGRASEPGDTVVSGA